MNTKKPLIVVRGHMTTIQGADGPVITQQMLNLVLLVNENLKDAHIILEPVVNMKYAKEHARLSNDVVYIGGTTLLWYKLKNILASTPNYVESYSTYIFKKCYKIMTTRHAVDFMIYEKLYKSGQKVTALYGPTELGTKCAVNMYQKYKLPKGKHEMLHIWETDSSAERANLVFEYEK